MKGKHGYVLKKISSDEAVRLLHEQIANIYRAYVGKEILCLENSEHELIFFEQGTKIKTCIHFGDFPANKLSPEFLEK